MAISDLRLTPEQLRGTCDPSCLDFATTADLPELGGIVGQERAMAALNFGLEVETPGYNIFVAGAAGTGRSFAVGSTARAAAAGQPTPDDWCYVYNFHDPRRPHALRLASGRGPGLAKEVDDLIGVCRAEIPRAFESEAYETRKDHATADVQTERNRVLQELDQEARREGFMIQPTPMGLVTVPMAEGRPMSREQFEALPDERRKEIDAKTDSLRERIQQVLSQVRQLEREARRRLEDLDREVALAALGDRFTEVRERYQDQPDVIRYLDALAEDVVAHHSDFRGAEQGPDRRPDDVPSRYRVNVLVTNEQGDGAPVIEENSPTYYNLFGRLEYRPVAAGAVTDHMLINAGSMHRANGGYLIVQALDVLTALFAWDALKRTLRAREIAIENIGEQWAPIPAATLRPDPIPLDVKIILIGSPLVYFLLYQYDEGFAKLFKVKAEFEVDMAADQDSCHSFALFAADYCRRNSLRHLNREAIARLVDHGKRLAEDQHKLSTRFSDVAGVLEEADFWAGRAGSDVVDPSHIDQALAQREYRLERLESRINELIGRGDLVIDVAGRRTGQVNGLAVLDMGDHAFGRPSRITARATPGRAGVVDIERESRLGGQIHQKAVLILSGYLAGRYGAETPLSLSATLAFEQSYGPIEGDSASCAELYAILSSLSGVPISQGIAVTGSMDQYGNVQVIGGVNEKIEGFYAACRMKGLTGDQGVMIPRQNMKNLMLKPQVVQAVAEGQFHIWAVSHVDEGIEILTGLPAGSPEEPDSVHGRAADRLRQFSDALRGSREERPPTIIQLPPGVEAPRPPRPPTPPREPPTPPPPPLPPR